VDVRDEAAHEEPADLTVTRHVELELVVTAARDADDPAGHVLAIAQVAQALGNLAPPFGLTGSSPLKRATAALVISSSASSSAMVRCA
jgi:hypothetical protein